MEQVGKMSFCYYYKEHTFSFNLIPKGLSWFQTSLTLTALQLRCMIISCHFRVAALSGHTALPFSPSSIALKMNRSQLSAICRCGQSGEVID